MKNMKNIKDEYIGILFFFFPDLCLFKKNYPLFLSILFGFKKIPMILINSKRLFLGKIYYSKFSKYNFLKHI